MTTHRPTRATWGPLLVRLASSVVGIGLALVVLAGCDVGPGIADQIRAANSSLVKNVEYRKMVVGAIQEIDVHLVPGATVAQAHQFWCQIVVPAAGNDLAGVHVFVLSSDAPKAGVDGVLADDRVSCSLESW